MTGTYTLVYGASPKSLRLLSDPSTEMSIAIHAAVRSDLRTNRNGVRMRIVMIRCVEQELASRPVHIGSGAVPDHASVLWPLIPPDLPNGARVVR